MSTLDELRTSIESARDQQHKQGLGMAGFLHWSMIAEQRRLTLEVCSRLERIEKAIREMRDTAPDTPPKWNEHPYG